MRCWWDCMVSSRVAGRARMVRQSAAAELMAAAEDPARCRRVLRRIARRLRELGVI